MLLPQRIKSEDWKPIGILKMEANALNVVHSTKHQVVIAGPGAGKTELLAQRAAYLLQTGGSPFPKRILSISFKRDAATNLKDRVRLRCHSNNANRFDSMTFDAFAKGLIDRFGQVLPERWRPRPDYEILFPNNKTYKKFLTQLPKNYPSKRFLNENFVKYAETFEKNYLIKTSLNDIDSSCLSAPQWAAQCFWHQKLHRENKTNLSFPMIGRLAELLFISNPYLCEALRLTYSHLFMDEFQDTTQVQYDLMKTIFLGSKTVITAVGDNKQQIMKWANAMDDPFHVFSCDFNANSTRIVNNYRSSPELVQIQYDLAKSVDPNAVAAVSQIQSAIGGINREIREFTTPEIEAENISCHITDSINKFNLVPRNFVILVRQKANDYAPRFSSALSEKRIALSNQSARIGSIFLQDLLAEPVSQIIILMLRVASSERSGKLWTQCHLTLSSIQGLDPDNELAQKRLSSELDFFCRKFKQSYPDPIDSKEEVQKIVEEIFHFIGLNYLINTHPHYRQGEWFNRVGEATVEHLYNSSLGGYDWSEALDNYEGTQSVPLMTIHKSKGLEFHTVILLGLEDDSWWSYEKNTPEEHANLFVAFSRAKYNIIFTYCSNRSTKNSVAPLYELLMNAGVKSLKFD